MADSGQEIPKPASPSSPESPPTKTREQYAEEFSKRADGLIERAAAVDPKYRTDVLGGPPWGHGLGVRLESANTYGSTDKGADHLYVIEKRYFDSGNAHDSPPQRYQSDSVGIERWREKTANDATPGQRTGEYTFNIRDRAGPLGRGGGNSYHIDSTSGKPVLRTGGFKEDPEETISVETILNRVEKGVSEAEARQTAAASVPQPTK